MNSVIDGKGKSTITCNQLEALHTPILKKKNKVWTKTSEMEANV